MKRSEGRLVLCLILAHLSCLCAGCGKEAGSPDNPEIIVEPHTVLTEDGVEIALFHYFPTGVPIGSKPILLCPGFSENHLAFDLTPENSMARSLAARGIDTWAIDLRGRGASGVPGETTPRSPPGSATEQGARYVPRRAPPSGSDPGVTESTGTAPRSADDSCRSDFLRSIPCGVEGFGPADLLLKAPWSMDGCGPPGRARSALWGLDDVGGRDIAQSAPWSVDDFGYLDIRAAAAFIAGRAPAGRLFLLGFSEGAAASVAYLLEGDPGLVCGHVSLAPAVVIGASAEDPEAAWPTSQFLFNFLHVLEPVLPGDLFIPFPEIVAALYQLVVELGLKDEALKLDLWNILWYMENMTEPLIDRALLNLLGNISSNVLKQFLRGSNYFDRQGVCTFEGSSLEREAGPFCYRERLSEITVPTLVLAGSRDLCVPEPNARYVFDRLGGADKEFRLFGVAQGDSFDYGHDDLTFGVHASRDVFPAVAAWVLARM